MMRMDYVFLGDSLTEWGPWDELLPSARILNLGKAGESTGDILERLDIMAGYNGSGIFLMAGINDLGNNRTPGETAHSYRKIVEWISVYCPVSELYLLSVLPVSEEWSRKPGLSIENIALLNSLIRNMAEEKGHSYIDLFPGFLDETGFLKQGYSTDGLHLNQKGYEIWAGGVVKMIKKTV